MTVAIVIPRPADAARLAEIHCAAFERPWSEAAIRETLDAPSTIALGANGRGGAIAAFLLAASSAGFVDILTLACAPGDRRKGFAKALVSSLVHRAGERGADRITLEVNSRNIAAIKLYRSLGFETAGERAAYYGGVDDALVLVRRLGLGAGLEPPPQA